MTTRFMTAVVSALAAASMTVHAQTPQTRPMPQPPDDPKPTITQSTARAQPAHPVMTITGCLQQRENAKATPPNIAERGGTIESYILSNVKMSPTNAVSGIGVSTKYEVVGIVEAELKKHLNHQVELMGQIVPPDAAMPADDSPDFRATTVKMLSVSCAAAQ